MNLIPLTDIWLNAKLRHESNQYGTFPSSSQPDKPCYEWEIAFHLVITSHPDDGYSLCIRYSSDCGDFQTDELRKLKYQHEVEFIYEFINEEKL